MKGIQKKAWDFKLQNDQFSLYFLPLQSLKLKDNVRLLSVVDPEKKLGVLPIHR